MLKLLKYLKKSMVPILAILLLLVFQAMCDLALPDYTSKIVNVGIQQGGVEDAVPQAVRKQTLDTARLFMTGNEQKIVDENYSLLDRNQLSEQDYSNEVKTYPALADAPIYTLNSQISGSTREQLNKIFGHTLLASASLNEDNEQAKELKQQFLQQLPQEQQQAMAQMSPLEIIQSLPANAQEQICEKIREQIDQMEDLIITQSATPMVKQEYQAIGMDVDAMQMWYILGAGVQMLVIALCSLAAVVVVTMLASRVAAALGMELRDRMYSKVLLFSGREMDQFSTASLITRCTNDIQQIQLLMAMLLRIVFYAPIIAIGGVIKVMGTQSSLLWVIALAVAGILAVVVVMFGFAMPKFKIMQKLIDRLNLILREVLTGLPVIRAFSTQKHEEKRFEGANSDLTKANIFINRIMACMMPTMMFIMNGVSVLIVWVGGHGVADGSMQVGNMMAVIQYSMQIIMAFLMISMISVMLPRASVAAKRVEEVLQTPVSITDPSQPQPFDSGQKGVVEFSHVDFKYPGAESNVLTDITFTARPGETTAIIGSTGCGKSTLVNLIPRFYDVTGGSLKVDGAEVSQVNQKDLRAKLGYVPQKGQLFSGDVNSNISYGKQLPQEEIQRAAQIAQAEEFILAKPEQYDSPITQGGTNVSGGQRQRLSIARAIAGRPEIYIFDDSFSALDYKTDRVLRGELKKATGDSTVLIVAQRISTIMRAEKILVLDQGRIVGEGTHKQLLQSCEVYREIAQSQLTKEELENA